MDNGQELKTAKEILLAVIACKNSAGHCVSVDEIPRMARKAALAVRKMKKALSNDRGNAARQDGDQS